MSHPTTCSRSKHSTIDLELLVPSFLAKTHAYLAINPAGHHSTKYIVDDDKLKRHQRPARGVSRRRDDLLASYAFVIVLSRGSRADSRPIWEEEAGTEVGGGYGEQNKLFQDALE